MQIILQLNKIMYHECLKNDTLLLAYINVKSTKINFLSNLLYNLFTYLKI